MKGKTFGALAIKGLVMTATGYMLYRIQGGPPIGKMIMAYSKIMKARKDAKREKIELRCSEYSIA